MKSTVIYEDDAILVIYKPAGLAVQTAGLGQTDCVSELKNYLYHKAPGNGEPYLAVIHRLDQPVEGLLVFAKSKAAAHIDAFHKTYYALVCMPGHAGAESAQRPETQAEPHGAESAPEGGWIRLEDGLMRDGRTGTARVVSCPQERTNAQEQDTRVKRAALSYRVLARESASAPQPGAGGAQTADGMPGAGGAQTADRVQSAGGAQAETALLEIELETGRFHQIRAQLSHHGMPILGDTKYGTAQSIELGRQRNIRSAALCACRLEIIHPLTGERKEWRCKPQNPAFQGMNIN